jgi:hypothetical protein
VKKPLKIPSAEEQEGLAAVNLWRERGHDGVAWLARRARAGQTSKAERELFAAMLEGTAKQRRLQSRAERWPVRLAIAKSLAMLDGRMQRTEAVLKVAELFGVSVRHVHNVLKDFSK